MKARPKRNAQKRDVPNLHLSPTQQVWLLVAVLYASLPIWFWLPLWVPVFTVAVSVWRGWRFYRGEALCPKWVLRLSLVIFIGANLASHWPPLGLEPMATLLLSACCLKYLEMRRLRDALLVVNLCYFLAGLQLLFLGGMATFFVALTSCIVTLSAQIVIQRSPEQRYSFNALIKQPFMAGARLFLYAVPLTVCIFIFAPRLPSFWVVPTTQGAVKTGVTDSMSPGSIGDLTRSDKLAFRVAFQTKIPDNDQLYWRGLTMSDFDGKSWRNGPARSGADDTHWQSPSLDEMFNTYWPDRPRSLSWPENVDYIGEPLRYTLYQEPTYQRWLFAIPAPKTTQSGLGMTADHRILSRQPITQRTRIDVESFPEYRLRSPILSEKVRARTLTLPARYNPRTLELGQRWEQEGVREEVIVSRIYQMFNRDFTYTLSPGVYGTDSVDEFLFDRKRGFCEHFASAAVVMLRASGVPARVVSGYQGGERSPYNDYLLVHQYDAHAWAEYWQPDTGWVRIDPTAAVAPERIENGARNLFGEDENFLADSPFSLSRFSNVALANWVRLRMDSVEYLWGRWVLGYNGSTQTAFLEKLFGDWNPRKLGLLIAIFAAVTVFGIWLSGKITQPGARTSVVERRYRTFERLCEKWGITIHPNTTPADIARQATHLPSELKQPIQALCTLFEKQLYGDVDCREDITTHLRQFRRMAGLKALRSKP